VTFRVGNWLTVDMCGKEPAVPSFGDVDLRGCQGIRGAQSGEACGEVEAAACLVEGLLVGQDGQDVVVQLDGEPFAGVAEDVGGVDEVVRGVGGQVGELTYPGEHRVDDGAVIHGRLVAEGVDDGERGTSQLLGGVGLLRQHGAGVATVEIGADVGVAEAGEIGAEREEFLGGFKAVGPGQG